MAEGEFCLKLWPLTEIHAPWGGVVPSLAQEAHRRAIARLLSDVSSDCLDAVAVTIGPGLSLCLRVTAFCRQRE